MKMVLKVAFANLFFGFTLLLNAQVKFEKDFNLDPAKQFIYAWTEINGNMYFSANDGYFGFELWRFDPMREEATRLTDLRPKGGSSDPIDMILYDDKVYFFAFEESYRSQLFYYDLKANRIKLASDFLFDGFNSGGTVVYNDKLWFSGSYQDKSNLWNYDASTGDFTEIEAPIEAHQTLFQPGQKVQHNGKIFFQGRSKNDQFTLWSYDDSTKSFAQEPSQYNEQGKSLFIRQLKECNNKLFMRLDLPGSDKPWAYYNEVVDSFQLITTNRNVLDNGCACVEDRFIFSNNDIQGVGYYDTNNAEIGYLRDEISNFPNWGRNIKNVDGKIYFNALYNNSYHNVYVYDPSNNETSRLAHFDGVEAHINTFVKRGDDFYSFASTEIEQEIFKFNPQFNAPKKVADINKANRNGFAENIFSRFHEFDNRFYFTVSTQNSPSRELWAKDINEDNFYNVSQIIKEDYEPVIAFSDPVNRNDRMFFSGVLSSEGLKQLVSYKTGEDSLIHHLNIPHVWVPYTPYFQGMMLYEEDIIFSVTASYMYRNQFFMYNPDTEELKNLPGVEDLYGDINFRIGDRLFLSGTDDTLSIFNNSHYSVDLQSGLLYEIKNDSLLSGTNSDMFKLGDKIAYGIIDPIQAKGVIEIFDPETQNRKTVSPEGFDQLRITRTAEFNNQVIFYDSRSDHVLFALDPITDSCFVLLDLESQGIEFAGEMIEFDNKLYFEGYTFESGREVFEYDPSTGVTRLYEDINIGGGDSSPEDFKVIGDRLYFTADDGFRGHELWSLSNCFKASLDAIPDSLGIANGQITVIVDGGQAPFTYKWNTGETGKEITGLTSGFYEVQIEDANGCQVSVFTILEGGLISSIDQSLAFDKYKIYPNPASDILYFDGLENFSKLKMSFYKANGLLAKQKYIDKGVSTVSISDLADGFYFLVLEREGQVRATYRLVVER